MGLTCTWAPGRRARASPLSPAVHQPSQGRRHEPTSAGHLASQLTPIVDRLKRTRAPMGQCDPVARQRVLLPPRVGFGFDVARWVGRVHVMSNVEYMSYVQCT